MPESSLYLEHFGEDVFRCLEQIIGEVKTADPIHPVTVIVPSMYIGLSLRRRLAQGKGLLNVRFMVMPRLAEHLGSPALSRTGKSPLKPAVRLAAIRHFGQDIAAMPPLGSLAAHPPLHEYLQQTFEDLDLLSAEQISGICSGNALLGQITAWYHQYKNLTRSYYDREELARAAAAQVSEGRAESALKDLGLIIFYLSTDLTPGEKAMLKSLGAWQNTSVVSGLTGEEETDREVFKLASGLEPINVICPKSGKRGRQIPAHILIAPDPYEEVRWVMRDIARLADKGMPFSGIAVVYRNMEPYGELVKNQLSLTGIPAAGPDPVTLRHSTAGTMLVNLIQVFEQDFSRESLMRTLSEAPVESSSVDQLRQTALWEEVSGKAGILSSARQWDERLSKYCRELEWKLGSPGVFRQDEEETAPNMDLELFTAALSLKKFVSGLVKMSPPPGENSWSTFAKWAVKLLSRYCSVETWPPKEAEAYEKVTDVCEEIGRLDQLSGTPVTLADFSRTLEDNLKSSSGRLNATGDGVFTGSLKTIQGMSFEYVYVLGMSEGAFPPRLHDNAIIPEALRASLGEEAPLKRHAGRRADERRVFLAALSAGKHIKLSYPRSGGPGRGRGYPSPWLVEQANIIYRDRYPDTLPGSAPVTSSSLESLTGESWISSIASTHDSLLNLGGLVEADLHDRDLHSLAAWHNLGGMAAGHFLMHPGTTGSRALESEKARLSFGFTPYDGNLGSLKGKSCRISMAGSSVFSATRLETWAKCPFRYFLQYVLEVPVMDHPEEILQISSLDRGSLVHTILERFIKTNLENGTLPQPGKPWQNGQLSLLWQIAEEEFASAGIRGITGRELLWNVVQNEIRDELALFIKEDDKLRSKLNSGPVAAEYHFGLEGGDATAVSLEVSETLTLHFRGKIDRLDVDASGLSALVLDYKTGSTAGYSGMKKDPLGAGTRLQLPVYALAARQHFGSSCNIRAAYWFVSTKGGFELKDILLDEPLEKKLKQITTTITAGIEKGVFPANPGGEAGFNNCEWCDYRRVCPADTYASWQRKSINPEVRLYTALANVPKEEDNS